MKVVMFISSLYGYECYNAVKKIENVEIVGIVTNPATFSIKYGTDKIKFMDNVIYDKLVPECRENNIPIHISEKKKGEQFYHVIYEWAPDLIVVSGWYHVIKEDILSLPNRGVIGLHSSILPKYRGGAPLVWQIINGEETAGITLFYMDKGTDTGDIIGQKEVAIEREDDIRTLYKKVGKKGIELLEENIPLIERNRAPRRVQRDLEKYEVYPQRREEDGKIQWSWKAKDIYNFVRAQTKPYSGAFSLCEGKKIRIWKCDVIKLRERCNEEAGSIVAVYGKEKYPIVSTGENECGIILYDYDVDGLNMKINPKMRFER